MKGYSLEIILTEWKCKCKTHVNGVCENPETNRRESICTSYRGGWGWNVKDREEAINKWAETSKALDGVERPLANGTA